MNNKLVIPLLIVILISLACGPTPATPTPIPPPTPIPTQPPPPTPMPTVAPTATRAPTATMVELPPTEEVPEEVESPAYYTEEFDIAGAPNWLYYVINGTVGEDEIITDNGKLIISLGDRNAWVNFLYDPWLYKDVQVTTLVTNRGTNTYFYGIVTRYTDADGFYMFLVNPGGMYGIWRFDSALANYYEIRTGGSTTVKQGKDTNEITALTIGDRLELIINGKSIWTTNDKNLLEGQVGLTMIGLGSTPLKAEFDYVDIREP